MNISLVSSGVIFLTTIEYDIFKCNLVKNKYFESFYLWHYSKGRNKTLKRLMLLNKSVESWESWKLFRGKRKLEGKQGSPEKWMTLVKKLSLKLNFSNIYYKLKFSHTFPRLVPFDLGPWKSIIGWRYNPNSMSLSILQF